MKGFLKTTKWWMFVPLTCLFPEFIRWVLEPTDSRPVSVAKVLFYFANVGITLYSLLVTIAIVMLFT
jgi:hypothetical protein